MKSSEEEGENTNKTDHYNKGIENKEESDLKSPSSTASQKQNFNPFVDVKDHYGGQASNLVILPRFPSHHQLASTQRLLSLILFAHLLSFILYVLGCI